VVELSFGCLGAALEPSLLTLSELVCTVQMEMVEIKSNNALSRS
jgi:hypothetical protein